MGIHMYPLSEATRSSNYGRRVWRTRRGAWVETFVCALLLAPLSVAPAQATEGLTAHDHGTSLNACVVVEPEPAVTIEPSSEPTPVVGTEPPSPEPSAVPEEESRPESATPVPTLELEPRSGELPTQDEPPSVAESPSPDAPSSASATSSAEPSPSDSASASATPSTSPTASPSPSMSASASASSPTLEAEGAVTGPIVCPPQPTVVTAAAQDGGALVSWSDLRGPVQTELTRLTGQGVGNLPAAGDVVTGVQVTVTAVQDASVQQVVTVSGDATQSRLSGLRNGVEYALSVMAFGDFGAGPLSDPVRFTPTTGIDGEIGGVLLKRDDAVRATPASLSAIEVDAVAVTDAGEAVDGVDKVALSEAVDVAEGEAIARSIAAQPEVQWAEPDLVVLPASIPASTGGGASDARRDWNITGAFGVGEVSDPTAGAGVTVAVIDTGITPHPDLDGRLVAGFDFVSNPQVLAAERSPGGAAVPFDGDYLDEAIYGGLGRDADPTDPGDWRGVAPIRDSSWHGTHIAGVIADVVPAAKIQPIRALSWRGGLLSDVAAGITWASGGMVDGTPANATPSKVINLSFSVQAACPNTLQIAIDDAVARGSVIVAAAGNNNADAANYAPGNCANVITAGAIDADGQRAGYSNYGSSVAASAPGFTPRTEREGTSIAAAHTAAALTVLASQDPTASPAQLSERLTGKYLRPFPGEVCDVDTSRSCGAGLVRISTGTTHVVTSTADSGAGTLRQAIIDANLSSGDTITFDASILPAVITLASSLPQITKPMTISGPGEAQLTIDANGGNRVFFINGGRTLTGVTISDLTVTGATNMDSNWGAVVTNTGATSVIRRVTVSNNTGSRLVYNKEAFTYLTLDDCTFTGNLNIAVFVNHGNSHGRDNIVTVTGSTFTNNATAIFAYRGIRVSDSTFTGNQVALTAAGGGDNEFINNSVTSNVDGVSMTPRAADSNSVTITGNTFTSNSGYGLRTTVTAPATATITGNTFTGNSPDLLYDGSSTVPAGILATNTFVDPNATPTPTPTSQPAPGVPNNESTGAGAPPEAAVPPPLRTVPPGVVLGSGVVMIDGVATPVRPQRAASGSSWSVKGPDFALEFVPKETTSGVLAGPEEQLRAPAGGQVQVSGDGYLGGSSVSVYLIPSQTVGLSSRSSGESQYLGDATVSTDGTFTVTFTVPASVNPGEFVLQVNGWSQDAQVRSVNLDLNVYAPMLSGAVENAAFFEGRSSEMSRNGKKKLRGMVAALPAVRQDVQVEITAVSVSLDDVEGDLRLAAERGRALRDELAERGVQGTYSVIIRTQEQLRSAEKTPPLVVSSTGKPLTTVRITFNAPR